jgi:hypothetical protein
MSIGDNRLPALADDIRKLHRSIERNAEKIAHDAIEADTTVKAPRQRRHLSDHILIAFHQACDERDLEVAERLLAMLAMVIAGRRHQPTAPDRRDKESLVAAYERLWALRHPDTAEGSDEPLQRAEVELTRSYGGDHDAMCRAWPALVMLTADLGARERAGGAAPFVAWLNQELEQRKLPFQLVRTDDVPPAARKRAVRRRA